MLKSEILKIRDQIQKRDIATILQTNDLNPYLLEICRTINAEYTKKFLKKHPAIKNKIKEFSTYPENPKKQEQAKILHYILIRYYEQATDLAYRMASDYDDDSYDNYEDNNYDYNYYSYSDQDNDYSNNDDNYNSSDYDLNNTDDYNALSLSNTYLAEDYYYDRIPYELDMVGKYCSQPTIEKLYEKRLAGILTMETIDGMHYNFYDYSHAGEKAFLNKMVKTVLKDPTSNSSKFYLKYEDRIAKPTEKIQVYLTIADGLITAHPDFAKRFIDKILESSSICLKYLPQLDKLYDATQYIRIKDEIKNFIICTAGNTECFESKILACKYSVKFNDSDLKEFLNTPFKGESHSYYIDENTISLLQENVDFQPFYNTLNSSSIKNIHYSLYEQNDDILQKILQNCPMLENISIHCEEFDARMLLENKNLKVIDFGLEQVNNAETLLEGLPKLEKITQYESFNNKDAFWDALMKHKPDNLEYIDVSPEDIEEEKAKVLMEKYPNLCIHYPFYYDTNKYDDSERGKLKKLYNRNAAIIKAKKSKHVVDIAHVIENKGIIEYLNLMDKNDRPTLEDWQKPTIRGNCFSYLETYYSDNYLETLKNVADLCSIPKLKKEATLLEIIKKKQLSEFLGALKPNERPSITNLLLDNMLTDKASLTKHIKNAYNDNYPEVIKEILTLYRPTDKELELLQSNIDITPNIEQYKRQLQYEKNAATTKSAYEKWKAQQLEKGV